MLINELRLFITVAIKVPERIFRYQFVELGTKNIISAHVLCVCRWRRQSPALSVIVTGHGKPRTVRPCLGVNEPW